MMTKKKILIVLLVATLAVSAWADENDGLLIRRVLEDSPAETAGLIRGDILLAIDGNEVNSIDEVRDILTERKAGQRIRLTIMRGGDETQINLTIEDRLYRPAIGLEFDIPQPRVGFGRVVIPRARFGVVIVEVVEDSPADRAGLEARDAIISLDGERISSGEFREIIQSHEPGDRIVLSISRPGDDGDEPFDVTIPLGENDDGDAYLGIQYGSLGMHIEKIVPELRERMEHLEQDLGRRMNERLRRVAPSFPPEERDRADI